ncbi:hypothetical protein MIR68_000170 [Amoeboaphelidium protococcarum]|nr:hypothetical protein MIR68_000170 [Amoeboaphelidium protococcarum]
MPLIDNQSDVSCAQVNDKVEAAAQQSVELLANMGLTPMGTLDLHLLRWKGAFG